jgi:hypothetical protein
MPALGERLRQVTFDQDGESLVVPLCSGFVQVGELALPSNPAGRRAPLHDGLPGVWNPFDGECESGPATVCFDLASVEGSFLAGCTCSMIGANADDLKSNNVQDLTRLFMDNGIASHIARHHSCAGAIVMLRAPQSDIPDMAYDILAWTVHKSGFHKPIIRTKGMDIRQLIRPEWPRSKRLNTMIKIAGACFLTRLHDETFQGCYPLFDQKTAA